VRYAALAVVVVGWLLSGAVPAQAETVLASGGEPGRSAWGAAVNCRYNRTNVNAWLSITALPPAVTGANLRRGRRDVTSVRYRMYLVDAQHGYTTAARSGWSAWLRARDTKAATWSGVTSFTAPWNGVYALDVRVEWWKGARLRGVRALRSHRFNFFTQYNVGPTGPYSFCGGNVGPF
jgi:hypothetical protein